MQEEIKLSDVVEQWLETQPALSNHISIAPIDDTSGYFYITMLCSVDKPRLLAYVGKHAVDRTWLHCLNPADPEFFEKLKTIMVDLHNSNIKGSFVNCTQAL